MNTKTRRKNPVQVMLSDDEFKKLNEICKNLGVSRAEYVRSLLKHIKA